MVVPVLAGACREFEDLLQRPRDEASDAQLQSALKQLSQPDAVWEGLDESQLASAAALLLGEGGLFHLAQKQCQDKEPMRVACRRYAFEAVARFLQLHGRSAAAVLHRRSSSIVQGCMHVYRRDASNQVGVAGLTVLLRVLETPGGPPVPGDLGDDLLRELKMKHSKLLSGHRACILRILAALADRLAADSTASRAPFTLELPQRLLSVLSHEVDSDKPVFETMAGALDAVDLLLRRYASTFTSADLQNLYDYVSVVALTADSASTRKRPQKTALRVLQLHAGLFRPFYINHALETLDAAGKPWSPVLEEGGRGKLLDKLLDVSNAQNPEVAQAGRATLDALLRSITDGMSWHGTATHDVEIVNTVGVKDDQNMATKSEVKISEPLAAGTGLKRLREEAVAEAEAIGNAGELPREAAVVRRWCAHFRAMVLKAEAQDDTPGVSLRKSVLIGVRSLGALAPAALRLDGGVVALDFLEVILDALDNAVAAPDHDTDEQGTPADRIANAMPEYAAALAHVVPVVSRWLTSSQWARVLAAGGLLLSNFSQAFTKQRPNFARSFAELVTALMPARSGLQKEAGEVSKHHMKTLDVPRAITASTEQSMLDVLVAQGLVLTVTQDEKLQALWELVLLHLESESKTEVEQQLVDSIVTNVLALARQGVDCHLLLQRQEERTAQQMADHVAKVRAKGSLFSMTRATATSPLSLGPEIINAVAEDDPNFSLHTSYIYTQAMSTVDLLNQIAAIFDRCFGKSVPATRAGFLKAWFDTIVTTVAELVVLGQNSGSPPPGIFRLLRAALTCCCHIEVGPPHKLNDDIGRLLPSLLEDIARAVEGYKGAVATEALEALLAVRPEWVNPERWLPVFRRAFADGLHDFGLAQHALHELERWRDASVAIEWKALLPSFVPYLQIRESEEADQGKSHSKMSRAEQRARRALPVKETEDRTAFHRRLFRFIGSLGGDCHALVVSEPTAEELQRPIAALSLRVPLVMGGSQIELEPALLLPHLAQIVKRSPTRSLRLAAAEGLHAIVRFVIGSDSVRTAEASTGEDVEVPTDFADALRDPLLPLALRASVDDDASLAQIFRALLGQLVAWFAHCPPTASLSSLRDALLEAMRDPQKPSLRNIAGRYYADLLILHAGKPAGTGAVVAKRLLQHLLASASHVDGCTQLGALQSMLWCVLAWEADSKSTDAVVETLKVVVHCLHTSNSDADSLSTANVALQLGRRLVRSLVKADAPYAKPTGELILELWRGAGSPDPTTRTFCREALVQLAPLQALKASPRDALEAVSVRLKESVAWDRLDIRQPAGSTSGGADVLAHALHLLAAQIDTMLWLASPGGGESLIKHRVDTCKCRDLAQRATDLFILIPWSGSVISREALENAMAHYTPREGERVAKGRMSALLSLVSFARFGSWPLSTRLVDVLLTLVLTPSTLLASNASWKSKAARRYVTQNAVAAIHRAYPTGTAFELVMTSWIEQHPDVDFTNYVGRVPGISAFEACFRQWPEHKRGDLRAVADKMEAYVDGIEELWQHHVASSCSLWDVLFRRWPGGVEAMVTDWRQSMSWHGLERKAEASQQLMQALMRFILIAVPVSKCDAGSKIPALLPEAGGERTVIEAVLCLPKPPKEAIPQLLIFFSKYARLTFDLMRPWTASRKRDFLSWLSDFSVFARENVSEKWPENPKKKLKPNSPKPEQGWDQEEGEVVLMDSIVKGSVLAQIESTKPGGKGLNQVDRKQVLSAESFAKLLGELPRWHEWAVSDAVHGGADDEDAPVMPPEAKRSKTGDGKEGAVSRRVRQSRADRTGLYQLASLLHSSATVEAVLQEVAVNHDLCQFLVAVLRSVLGSERSSPRMKAHFLTAIPPLLLKSEVRTCERMGTEAVKAPPALEEAAIAVATCVREMVLSYFPLRSHDYSRDSEEYSTYLVLLNGLFRALELSAPSVRLLPALYGTLRENGHREEHRLRGFVGRFVGHLASAAAADKGMLAGSFTAILGLFLDESLDDRAEENVRFALMEKLGLPLLMELTQTDEGCVEAWVTYWPQLLELANTKIMLGCLKLGDTRALHLKITTLSLIYSAIEILFMRTTSEVLRERIAPRLPLSQNGQQSSPSRDLIPRAKSALERPPGWETLDRSVLRRYHLRVYAALSAAICATQAKLDLYSAFLFKEDRLRDLVEPWTERSVDLSALSPNTEFSSFSRPGYAFAFRAAIAPRGRFRRRGLDNRVLSGESTLLGTNLWGATQASLPGTFTVSGDLSLQTNVLRRAVINKAVQSLNVATPGQQKALAASVAHDTQGATTLGNIEDSWSVPPAGAEGAALRLQCALRGLRPVDAGDDGVQADHDSGKTKWLLEWVELDAHLFPGGPSSDCNLSLLLTLLRMFDVMVLRFGVDSGRSWLLELFASAERPTADFWFKLIFIKLLVLRSDTFKPFLYGQDPRFFRFLVGVMLDPRFGAEKRFHYLFRDILQGLIVPLLGATEAAEGESARVQAPAPECAYDAERLLHQLQKLCPHNETYWQKNHIHLLKLYVMHYTSSRTIDPDRLLLSKQLTASSQIASVLQHSALRQLAILVEFGGFDPFRTEPEADPLESHWSVGLLACIGAKDYNIAAYSCGVVGLLAKWHPMSAANLLEESCKQIYDSKDKHEPASGRRILTCIEELLKQCPWALCEVPSSSPATSGSSARRKLFTLMVARLQTVQGPTVKHLLEACLALCRDCAASASATAAAGAAPGAWMIPGGAEGPLTDAVGRGVGQQTRRTPPIPPGGEELRRLQRDQRSQLLLAMRSGDVWRNVLLSADAAIRKPAASLVHVVAPVLDEENLLSCVGLMLEAVENLRERQTLETKERDAFMQDVLAVCLVVCDRRSDVARGEVLPGISSFLVHAATASSQGDLQEKARAFWETQLSGDAAPRLTELCTIASSLQDIEQVFIPAALQMLLPLARRSAEYRDRRKLVRKPLAECEFKPMQLIDASSWNATQGLRTFQPAASYASAFRETMAQSVRTQVRRAPGSILSRKPDASDNSVMGTLAPGTVPSQMISRRLRASNAPSADGSSVQQAVKAAPMLLRRSEKDAKNASIRFNERQTKAALATIEWRESGGQDIGNLQLTCSYRMGDFPDVEVSVEDIIEPLMRAGLHDAALGEELLLAIWTGIASSAGSSAAVAAAAPVSGVGLSISMRSSGTLGRTTSGSESGHTLQSALSTLLERGGTDPLYVHFLHRLVMRCSQDGASWIPLPALQKSISTSLLSGVQALEELLPSNNVGRSIDGGRHRVLLSGLYEACAALGEQSSMEAAAVQLDHIKAFSSSTSQALKQLLDGHTGEAYEECNKILKGEGVLPQWELRMVTNCRESALEALMSWDDLQGILQRHGEPVEATATSDLVSLRTQLGRSVMDEKLDAQSFLDAKLQHSQSERAISVRGAGLLATHAASLNRRDDAQRLLIQGYDAFVNAWGRIPHLATRAKHELLSSLPLLHTIEDLSPTRQRRTLSAQHDAFSAWIDSMLAKVVVAKVNEDPHLAAMAYMEIGHRCRKAGNIDTAEKMMRRCMTARKRQHHEQFAEVIKLKLDQGKQKNEVLRNIVEKEAAKHPIPGEALSYMLLLIKVAIKGSERDEAPHQVVWDCMRQAQSIADQCGPAERSITYTKLAEFADGKLRQAEQAAEASPGGPIYLESPNRELAVAVVQSVLKVLQIGRLGNTTDKAAKAFSRAHQRLPRVFELLAAVTQLSNQESAALMAAIPPWVLLRWLPQALAHLPKVSMLLSPLKSLARCFPQALIWPLQLSSQQGNNDSKSHIFAPIWAELDRSQAPVQLAITLTKALECLMHPDQRFSGELRPLRDALNRRDAHGSEAPDWASGKALWRKMWRKCIDLDTSLAGSLHVDFAKRLQHEIQRHAQKCGIMCATPELSDKDFGPGRKEFWTKFLNTLDAFAKNQSKQGLGRKEQVELFSIWLRRFDARSSWHGSMDEWLEVPGQYSGHERPDPNSHIRILRFAPHIMVMPSKQRPKRLIVLGSDEREHWFLVKGGEDLRLDARIEQLFEAINDIIAPEAVPGLRIRTVAVVPLLPDLGIIEWATGTRTLKSVVLEMSAAKDLREVETHKQRVEWANTFGAGLKKYEKICQLPKSDVEVAFKRCVRHLPPEATLRAFLWRIALGPEALWHLRQRFAASLAATSIASYILGIGDRHLDNFLVHVESAELVPIDFGYSFGIGALLPVPELVPFRLTGFICSVLQPLAGERIHGPFRSGITTVLSRCRRNYGVLVDASAIFIREPLLDWAAEARRKGEEVDFMPRKRLRFLAHRLKGRHPAKILGEELKDNPQPWIKKMMQVASPGKVCPCPSPSQLNFHCRNCGRPWPSFIEGIVAGLEDEERKRTYNLEGMLTPAEQADCLIQQATDPTVLGRAWEGWAPEI